MAHLHKNARVNIPDNLLLIYKMLILCLLGRKHFQDLKTVLILKFGPPVAKIIKFEF